MIALFARIAQRIGVKSKEAERFAKFVVVGTLGFIIDFGMLTILIVVVDLPGLVEEYTQFSAEVGLVLANTISFTLAVVSNFTFNRYWTYPESRSRQKRVQLPQFGLVSVIGLVINNVIFALTTPLFDRLLEQLAFMPGIIAGYIPAKMLATVVVLFWNFFVNRYWTYGDVE
jgi:putative flippase GtrA